ncbi:hypothetical protein RTP6_003234 [Batrachochytrium dendrobatidis]
MSKSRVNTVKSNDANALFKSKSLSQIPSSPLKPRELTRINPSSPATSVIPAGTEDARRSFDEWMKIAAENNISTANTWNLALIDYFHDMSVLRDGSSINFQKASCTLDGCVKIYTSRIDSVDSETKRLLDSLSDRENRPENGETAIVSSVKTKSKSSAKTLQEDVTELNWKHMDAEFSVDPLFKKTAAEFDEGGAQGLLLNHLMISADGKVLFDASDVMMDSSTADDMAPLSCGSDILSAHFEQLFAKIKGNLSSLDNFDICPTFSSFRFDNSEFYPKTPAKYDTMMQQQDDPDDYGDVDNYDPYDQGPMVEDDDGYENYNQDSASQSIHPLNLEDISSMSIAGETDEPESDAQMSSQLFSYFDANAARNWAGPEYWRSRSLRVNKKTEGSVESTNAAKPKRSQQAPTLDFLSNVPIDREAIFTPPAKPSLLPKNSTKELSTHQLPPDMHVSSANFLKYFLKPHLQVSIDARSTNRVEPSIGQILDDGNDAGMHTITDGQLENEYNNPLEYAGDDDGDEYYDFGQGGNDGHPSDPTMYNSKHSVDNSNIIDLSLDQGGDYKSHLGTMLSAGVSRQSIAPLVGLARSAKRVDVKKLKDNIWKTIDVERDESNSLQNTCASDITKQSEYHKPKVFSSVVSELCHAYSPAAYNDISVAFCFICVLHLANEKNLEIHGSSELEDLQITVPNA